MIWSNLASTLLKANEKELFKTYPKLNKKYPDSQRLLFTECSVLIKKIS